jgi:hypothetical protein
MQRAAVWIRALLVVLWLAFAVPADAQSVASLQRLEVAIWPEYDRPAALVILRAELDPAEPLPAAVELPIPAEVGEPFVVAQRTQDGRLLETTYSRRVDGDWVWISVSSDSHAVWLEYYAELEFDGQTRYFNYEWPGGLDVGEFAYEVLQPPGASELTVSPPGDTLIGEDGLTYVRAELGPQAAASTVSVQVEYRKPGSELVVDAPALTTAGPLDRVQVALWPEYDRAATLVILQAQLPAGTPVPAAISLPIPAQVGEPSAVAFVGEDGTLLTADYTRTVRGDWAVITIQTETAAVWLEYYADLSYDDDLRSFTYTWPGGLEVGTFGFEVQQPAGADALQVSPQGVSEIGADGLLYQRGELGPQTESATISISLSYSNPTSQLTRREIGRPDVTSGGTPDVSTWLPWLLGGFGLLLVVGGALFMLRMNRAAPVVKSKPRRKRRRQKAEEPKTGRQIDASPVFCHSCGTQASVSDIYCRRCGTQLRR